MSEQTDEKWGYTPYQVAEKTSIPYRAVMRLIRSGELHATKPGTKSYIVSREAVAELLNKQDAA